MIGAGADWWHALALLNQRGPVCTKEKPLKPWLADGAAAAGGQEAARSSVEVSSSY